MTISEALAEPFELHEIKFKPTAVKDARCLAIAFVGARAIMDRLDQVVGIDGWKTEYKPLGPDSVECRLSIKFGDTWVTKADVGTGRGDELLKAAYSDSLKRAAVTFGIGRYLYRLPKQWVDFDPVKKQIIQPPALPDWAIRSKQLRSPADAARARFRAARNVAELSTEWDRTPSDVRREVAEDKEKRKAELSRQR